MTKPWKERRTAPRIPGQKRSVLEDAPNRRFLIGLAAVELFLFVGVPAWWLAGYTGGWTAIGAIGIGIVLLVGAALIS